jgi:N-acetylmuramic acid 6-phosphate etherase
MIDLRAMSAKLVDRGERIVMEVGGVDRATARRLIADAGGSVPTAIVMQRRGLGRADAERALCEAGGVVRRVLADAPPPVA